MGGFRFQDNHPADRDPRRLFERRQTRNLNRRLFREMIKTELEHGSLSWFRRRNLLRFATRLDIDDFEAKLIVRAVEFEFGRPSSEPSNPLDESPIQTELIATTRHAVGAGRNHFIAILVMSAIAVLGWMLVSG